MLPKSSWGFLPVALFALIVAGCAGTSRVERIPANVHPGFDTWQYPGEEALQAWRDDSPYQWVGFYLPAPCRRDSSWVGQRQAIERLGWGMAVVYVGQQVFEGQPATNDLPPERILCSRTLLTPAQGRLDAQDAVAETLREGFQPGFTIYLNVERVSAVTDSLAAYYQEWNREVLRDGRFMPGTYAHQINAADLFALAQEAYRAAGRAGDPPFWVAGGSGFALDQPPTAAGFPFADVWQGALDVQRTYGGVTLQIDENTARSPSPSGAGL
jgi:hypothetical protein